MQASCEITFGSGGNAESFQLEGWIDSGQEGLTYAVGPASRLRLPEFSDKSDLLAVLEGEPVNRHSHPPGRRVRVLLDDRAVGHFSVDEAFVRCLRIKRAALRKGSILDFRHPDRLPALPEDPWRNQRLSVAWRRMRFFAVPRARPPADLAARPTTGMSAHDDRTERWSPLITDLGPVALSDLLSSCSQTVRQGFILSVNLRRHRVGIAADLPDDVSLIRCSVAADGALSFDFSEVWLDRKEPDAAKNLVFERWKAILPVFEAYATTRRIPGSLVISLGDEAHARGLAFCGKALGTLLIPDPYFLRSHGYEELRQSVVESSPEFDLRKPVALWRGSSTGYRGAGGLLDLDRVRLCCLGKGKGAAAVLDAGFTSLVQLENGEEGNKLRRLGLMADFVPPNRLTEWMFHIDVDGNTNSWPGLFQKLLSGSLVFKVTSASGWRQWYYDRLVPHEHFIPIASDLSDLIETITYFQKNIAKAKEVAEKGRSLALAMSYNAEVARAMRVIEDGIARERFRG